MRMYDIGNTNRIGFWVCAKDENSALNIVEKRGHIKNRKNARIHDITEQALEDDKKKTDTLKQILNGNKQGRLMFQGVSYSFQEVLQGITKKPIGWILEEVE